MTKHPLLQNQHRLSQIYLKKFGYKEEGIWMLSVMKLSSGKIENVRISEFTAEINIFDLPFDDFNVKRQFEIINSKLENEYPKLINNIKNQKQLISKDKDLLNLFIPNILCRTIHFRAYMKSLIENIETRKKLLNEITLFQKDEGKTEFLLDILNPTSHLNIVAGALMNHMHYVLQRFKKLILKSPSGFGWLTTDNPVYIDLQEKHEWIIPLEAEIYFPLSKEYCVFLFHEQSELNSNPLRNLKKDKVNEIDFETFDKLAKRIGGNLDEYLIFSGKYESVDLRD